MRAEIIAVGTELLLGDIVNTNAQYLARRLSDMGIFVFHQSVVGDNSERLKKEFQDAFSRADIVITTGGLGPTPDDLTKETAAEFFNKDLIKDQESYDWLYNIFVQKQNRPFTEGNKKQAYFPEDCTILPNPNGTAPGCIIEENNKILVVLPGPPRETYPMFENFVVPYLSKFTEGILQSKVLRICGIGEGNMAEVVKDILEYKNPTVAPYAKEGEVILRITAKGNTEAECKLLIEPVEKEIRSRIGEFIYAVGETSLEEVIGTKLLEKGLTIATAESCTGGLVASKLINYPGISSSFIEGVITYSNESKIKRLNVKKETLEKFSAVSEETALEMAKGIAMMAGTDIGVSTTGIAGPDGGSVEKPVGLAYIGIYYKGETQVKKVQCSGTRDMIRNRITTTALDFLRKTII